MRAFIAIELDTETKKKIVNASKRVRTRLREVKWVERENLHITLKFLGEINDQQVKKVKKIIEEVASGEKDFLIKGGFIGGFPSLNRARIVFFGIEKGKSNVIRIFDTLEQKLSENGFSRDKKPYHPHITIGRAKKRFYDLKDFRDVKVEFEYHVKSIVLYKSTLRPEGPLYEVVFKGELGRNG